MEYNNLNKIYKTDFLDLYHCDCMELLRQTPDNYYSLALVDPPYGNNLSGGRSANNGWNNKIDWNKCNNGWNLTIPTPEYFIELQRVSKNQIIFGGNYFADLLEPSRCWIVWDKMQRVNQADAELAWTSFTTSVRVYQYHCSKLQGFQNPNRFHPTEKPISLYEWILDKYAKPNDLILDTHLGSGSSRIASYKGGFNFVGFEIDTEYYEKQEKRFKDFVSQLRLF